MSTLRAVKEGRLTLDSLSRSPQCRGASSRSRWDFRPAPLVTVDNALKMLMVRSSNDIAVVLAEGVAGSIESFADR